MYEMPTKESNASRERDATKETHGLISQYESMMKGYRKQLYSVPMLAVFWVSCAETLIHSIVTFFPAPDCVATEFLLEI